ncbi:MAG: enoyl-CoA hydratase-related protein [Actinomycetota bacterium]|nr:enoyl-CoA hydratase-related protein [Actinomycetota bacterium]
MSDTDAALCTYDVADAVATIAFNRPANMNGMIGNMEVEYFRRLLDADADPAVRVIVLTGNGRAFCPGADLAGTQAEGDEPLPNASISTTTPLHIRKPMIAAINGACAGVGLAYALQCDLRIAASGVKFTTAFARRGLIGEYGMPWLLNQIAGRAVALDLLLSGRVFLADEALRLGLVNQVVDGDDLATTVREYALDLASNVSPASMATIKRQVAEQAGLSGDAAVAHSDELMRQSLLGPDVREGIDSFLQRRQVEFPALGAGTVYPWMVG